MNNQHNTQTHAQERNQTAPLSPRIAAAGNTHGSPSAFSANKTPYSFDQQQRLMKTASQLLAASTPEELWPIIKHAVQSVLAADKAAIFLYDTAYNTATCPTAVGLSNSYIENICNLVLEAPSHQLWTNHKPIIINDVVNDLHSDSVKNLMKKEGVHSCAIFPLITAENELLGSLVAYRDKPIPFSPQDSDAGQTLAHISALAVQNVELYSETRLNLIREQHLNHLTRTLASATDLPSILGQVIYTAAHIVGADAGLLGLVIDRQVMTFYPHNIPGEIVLRPVSRGRGIAWQVVQENKSVLISDYPSHYMAQERWINAGVNKLVAVPITAVDKPLGTLIMFTLRPSQKQFSPREVALLESIGYQAGIAIQNARMFAEADQRTTALRNALNRQAELDDLKNKFVQNVSHELRTPLGIIHGHAELLGSEALGRLESRQADSINIIQRRVRMLIDLVNDLTALLAAETQELRREEINPTYLAYSMLDEYRLQARDAQVTLEADISEDIPSIMGDLTHLRRVFDNLMANAFKFTPENGTVHIKVWGEGDKVFLEVSDTGIGIPQEQLRHIFDRFYQVEAKRTRRYPGTGLGLALVKEIVEAHRGEVIVSSEVGRGTTFKIMLPVSTA